MIEEDEESQTSMEWNMMIMDLAPSYPFGI